MHYVKELIHSGIEVKISDNDDKDIQIAALKGMLDATEQRLLFMLEKEKASSKNGQ